MKLLIDPECLVFIEALSLEESRTLLLAIFDYPNRDCDLPVWTFIRRQLDKDAVKYREKCARLSEVRQMRWSAEQNVVNTARNETEIKQDSGQKPAEIGLKSSAIHSNSSAVHNNSHQGNATALIQNLARSFNPNNPVKFTIDHQFSLVEIIRRNVEWAQDFNRYPPEHLATAQQSLIKKCHGHKMTIQQILEWVEREGKYNKQ